VRVEGSVAGGKKIDGEWFAYGLSLGLVLLHDLVIFSLLILHSIRSLL
jgi:hypothetical protein